MPRRPLGVLIVEDSEDDTLLLVRELRRGGFDVSYERVDGAAGMRAVLNAKPWDIVISDYAMPQFSGLEALRVLQESGFDLPFILVSGVAGEDCGMEAMRCGAHDYLVKKRLARLVPAVERELREAEIRGKRRHAEALLLLHTEALDAAANGIVITDREGTVIWLNPAVTALTGYSEAELLGRNPRILKSDRQDEAFYRNLWDTILEGRVWQGDLINRHRDGHLYTEEMTITPVRGSDGNIANFIAIKQDVTDRKNAQLALAASATRYRRLFETAREGILVIDGESSTITDVNPFLLQMLGYTRQEMLAEKPCELAPFQSSIESHAAFQHLPESGYVRCDDVPLTTVAGATIDVELVSHAFMADGKPVIQCTIRDITERKRAETTLRDTVRQLQSALTEKTVLLQEVHHRVKNNLAVVASLLSMQADRTVGAEAKRALEESQQRVHSMALIHEHLYGNEHLDRIEFSEFLRELVHQLARSSIIQPGQVTVELEAEPLELGIHRAVPCALIINELASNAFKHAFPKGRCGHLKVVCHTIGPLMARVIVVDDGVGMEPDLDWKASGSLGLQIVDILGKQLGATISVESHAGTRFEVVFPLDTPLA